MLKIWINKRVPIPVAKLLLQQSGNNNKLSFLFTNKSFMADQNELSTLTHSELVKITSEILKELLSNDLYLSDLPTQVTLDEINNQSALLHGKSITVYVVRENEVLPVIVPQGKSRVHDLKLAFKRTLSLKLERNCSTFEKPKKISWKHVWKTWDLQCDTTILKDDNVLLQEYGVVHKSYVKFAKKRREKSKIRRPNVTCKN